MGLCLSGENCYDAQSLPFRCPAAKKTEEEEKIEREEGGEGGQMKGGREGRVRGGEQTGGTRNPLLV